MKPKQFKDLYPLLSQIDFSHEHENGFQAEIDDSDLWEDQNENCAFKKGDMVQKATHDIGDIHQIGHGGVVLGCLYLEEEEQERLSKVYVVHFLNDKHPALMFEWKIKPLK